MDDVSSPAPAQDKPLEITPDPITPVPAQPPEQEHQTASPLQTDQTTTPVSALPASEQVSGPAVAVQPSEPGTPAPAQTSPTQKDPNAPLTGPAGTPGAVGATGTAQEGNPRPEGEEPLEITGATTIDELVKGAFFVADEIGEPNVNSITPHHISLHYPLDDSTVSIRLEARPGKWGGIHPLVHTDDEREKANKSFDDQKKILDDRIKTAQAAAKQESTDDATARRDSKPESVEA